MAVRPGEIVIYLRVRAVVCNVIKEIGQGRAKRVELIRFNLCSEGSEESISAVQKVYSALIRTLKRMKQKGRIQFIATEQSFADRETESIFLANKYPDLFESDPTAGESDKFIFVKI